MSTDQPDPTHLIDVKTEQTMQRKKPACDRITLPALFVAFLEVSLCAVGGPLVWARRMMVEKKHWLSDQEFAEILSFCQFLPGPNVVSITVCIGAKFRGVAGALAALSGFVVIPWTVGFAFGAVLLSYAHAAALQGICAISLSSRTAG